MNLSQLSTKLRKIADLVDEITYGNINETPKTAKKIINDLKAKQKTKGLHWTQRPENKKRLAQHIKKMNKVKYAQNN